MRSQEDHPPSRCPKRLQPTFIRACALTVLVGLVFYAIAQVDLETNTAMASIRSAESWNISSFIQSAVHQIQKSIMQPKIQRKRKLVLLWTDYFSETGVWLPSTKELQCPVRNCDVTRNHSLLNQSSAVLMHWRDVDINNLPDCDPSKSGRCPLWVLFNKEAPPHTSREGLELIQDRVHWTITYRNDSDIHAPYGRVVAKKGPIAMPEYNPNRRLLCWLVSNCHTHSKREIYVKELQKHLEVDIYGKCSTAKCPFPSAKACYTWLAKRCKFYLSLENSNCKDYVTEKLYYALASSMVPVVMGNSSNYGHLPPRSYINAADFSSPKELAEYLVSVGTDERIYQSFSWWRRNVEVEDASYKWLCQLCEKLHSTDIRTVKPRGNLVTWWFEQSGCMS